MEAAAAAAPTSTPASSSSPDTGSTGATPAPEAGSTTQSTPAPESGKPSVSTPDPKPAAPPPPRRLKVKVDGEETEVDEAELLRGYQTSRAAAKRMEEVARQRKEVEAAQRALKARLEAPEVKAIMAEMGLDDPEDAIAILRARKLVEREQMSPEQRALADERRRREEAERKYFEKEKAETKARTDAETRAEIQRINIEIPEAAAKVGLPKSPRAGQLVIGHMLKMIEAGEVANAHEAARYAMDVIRAEHRDLTASMDDAQLEAYLGKETVARILKRSVERARGQVAADPNPPPGPAVAGEKPRTGPLSVDEWRARFR